MPKRKKRIVIKVGSNVVAQPGGGLDLSSIEQLTNQISTLNKKGIDIILISSGAVAAGRSLITPPKKTDEISKRQLFASVGQIKLINIYAEQFAKQDCLCAQVLVTKEDFRDREHYINMKKPIKSGMARFPSRNWIKSMATGSMVLMIPLPDIASIPVNSCSTHMRNASLGN